MNCSYQHFINTLHQHKWRGNKSVPLLFTLAFTLLFILSQHKHLPCHINNSMWKLIRVKNKRRGSSKKSNFKFQIPPFLPHCLFPFARRSETGLLTGAAPTPTFWWSHGVSQCLNHSIYSSQQPAQTHLLESSFLIICYLGSKHLV